MNVYVLVTMALKPRRDKIRSMHRRLRNETSGEHDAFEISGSLEELSIQPKIDADRPQIRAAAGLK